MTKHNKELNKEFFERPVVRVAQDLIGTYLVREINGEIERFTITETEAYEGEEDLACHASKGRTRRTEVMFGEAGVFYVYLIYGMYWLINVVTGPVDEASAVLIRGVRSVDRPIMGPGRVGKALHVDGSFTGKKATKRNAMWFEKGESIKPKDILRMKRVGVDYAGPIWAEKLYRFVLKDETKKKQKIK